MNKIERSSRRVGFCCPALDLKGSPETGGLVGGGGFRAAKTSTACSGNSVQPDDDPAAFCPLDVSRILAARKLPPSQESLKMHTLSWRACPRRNKVGTLDSVEDSNCLITLDVAVAKAAPSLSR